FDTGSWRACLCSGMLLGLSNLTRTLTLLAMPGYVVCLAVRPGWHPRRQAVGRVALFVFGFAFAVGPWILRQHRVHGLTSISDNTAIGFYAATSPKHGYWTSDVERDAEADGVAPTVKAHYDYYMARAYDNLRADPWFYVGNVLN